MSRKLLLRIAGTLSLITCAGHTVGTFMSVPVEQKAMHSAIATMKATMVPMPVGAARSYMQILDGNNLCTSVFLLLCAAQLFAVAGAPAIHATNRILLFTAFALACFAVISALYFFPVPAALTGLAAGLSFVALSPARTRRLPAGGGAEPE